MRSYLKTILDRVRRRILAQRFMAQGNKFYKRDEMPKAIEAYRLSIEADASMAVVHYNLGLALYKTGSRLDARAEWQIALKLTDGRNAYLHEQTKILLRQFG
jgi:tetratricopeptide (TPR) repeat protein